MVLLRRDEGDRATGTESGRSLNCTVLLRLIISASICAALISTAMAQKVVSPAAPNAPAPPQLQPPSPGAGENRELQQTQAQTRGQKAETDQRGTEASPLIVKVHPTPKSQQEAEQDARDRAEKAANDKAARETNRYLILIGFLQFAVFVGQLFVYFYQAVKLRQTVAATQKAATASALQARALIGAEGSIVRVSQIYITPHASASTISGGPPPEEADIYIEFFNYGRTPAFPLRASIGHAVVESLPPEPKYIWKREYEPGVVIRDKKSFDIEAYHIRIQNYSATRELLDTHKIYLWIFGIFECEDVFGGITPWKFCFGWLPYFPPSRQMEGSRKTGGFIPGGPDSYRQTRFLM